MEDRFDEFWQLYPRRKSKRAARKSWDREIKAGTDPQEIIDGLRRQLPELMRKEPQFRPHPSTWLNQARWEDELDQPAQSSDGGSFFANAANGRVH